MSEPQHTRLQDRNAKENPRKTGEFPQEPNETKKNKENSLYDRLTGRNNERYVPWKQGDLMPTARQNKN
jgi:hypothetical protein